MLAIPVGVASSNAALLTQISSDMSAASVQAAAQAAIDLAGAATQLVSATAAMNASLATARADAATAAANMGGQIGQVLAVLTADQTALQQNLAANLTQMTTDATTAKSQNAAATVAMQTQYTLALTGVAEKLAARNAGWQNGQIENLQMVLDIAGIVDPYGIADGLSGAISLYQGQYLSAAMSVAAIGLNYIGPGGTAAEVRLKMAAHGDDLAAGFKILARNGDEAVGFLGRAADNVLPKLDNVPLSPAAKLADTARTGARSSDELSSVVGTRTCTTTFDPETGKIISTGCFVAGTEVYYVPEGTSVWYVSAAVAGVLTTAELVRQLCKKRKREDDDMLDELFADKSWDDQDPNIGTANPSDPRISRYRMSTIPEPETFALQAEPHWSTLDGSQSVLATVAVVERLAITPRTEAKRCNPARSRARNSRASQSQPSSLRGGISRWSGMFVMLTVSAICLFLGINQPRLATKPIEQMELGDRVPSTVNPSEAPDFKFGADVDPPTWRKITLMAPKSEGEYADVRMLVPLWWLQERDAAAGGEVWISVPECGIDGNAKLLSVEPCPPINPGKGYVVTAIFKHSSAHVVDLYVEGMSEPIGTTGNHRFWSEDRQEFVRADALHSGEQLRGLANAPRVIAVVPRPKPETVYNLEILIGHVYHVSATGILVHNTGDNPCLPIINPRGWNPHYVEWDLRGPRGQNLGNGNEISGLDFKLPKDYKLTFPEQSWFGHTEGKVISDLIDAGKLKPGTYLALEGTLEPCSSCKNLMAWTSAKYKMTIEYIDGNDKHWVWVNGILQ